MARWTLLIELREQCLFLIDTFRSAGQYAQALRYFKLMVYIENKMRVI